MAQFDYELPRSAIAQVPAEPRDHARLLDARGTPAVDRRISDLPDLIEPGDLLVVNDTRVLPARLRGRKRTGGAVEVLLIERGPDGWWDALVRPSARVPVSGLVMVDGRLSVEVGASTAVGGRRVRLLGADGEGMAAKAELVELERAGELPLPPYISTPLGDPDRYQTVYARSPRSVAAPTAGLHLTNAVLERCRRAGAEVASVELVVGLATFRPIDVDDPADHTMHDETYSIPAGTWDKARRSRRVIAVGTTTVRALESAARGEMAGRTGLFIRSDFDFEVVDLLLTNFHMPRSSLLLLVDAFIGPRWREIYEEALARDYRFLSFGDAMLLERDRNG
ncbi:MAG TPA: tRNA preQ1(34) S-adenosylmethionine ribosyltransferase-isomerase QueA [Acidimicrobiales bacterium]|jgi:S-adenosylmethionine:tRNA ribosyltransferase-isomerase